MCIFYYLWEITNNMFANVLICGMWSLGNDTLWTWSLLYEHECLWIEHYIIQRLIANAHCIFRWAGFSQTYCLVVVLYLQNFCFDKLPCGCWYSRKDHRWTSWHRRHYDSSTLWQLDIMTARHHDSSASWQLDIIAARHHDSSTSWQLDIMTSQHFDISTFQRFDIASQHFSISMPWCHDIMTSQHLNITTCQHHDTSISRHHDTRKPQHHDILTLRRHYISKKANSSILSHQLNAKSTISCSNTKKENIQFSHAASPFSARTCTLPFAAAFAAAYLDKIGGNC